MHPSFALSFERIVSKGGIMILRTYLLAGTAIDGNSYVVNRHKGTFGDDAEFWKPKKWLEKHDTHKRKLEQGVLTVNLSVAVHFLPPITSSLVRCGQTDLHRKTRRCFRNQKDNPVPYSQL